MASPLIERFCGKLDRLPSEITSSGTSILLHFVSDNVNDTSMDRGFVLQHSGGLKSSNELMFKGLRVEVKIAVKLAGILQLE